MSQWTVSLVNKLYALIIRGFVEDLEAFLYANELEGLPDLCVGGYQQVYVFEKVVEGYSVPMYNWLVDHGLEQHCLAWHLPTNLHKAQEKILNSDNKEAEVAKFRAFIDKLLDVGYPRFHEGTFVFMDILYDALPEDIDLLKRLDEANCMLSYSSVTCKALPLIIKNGRKQTLSYLIQRGKDLPSLDSNYTAIMLLPDTPVKMIDYALNEGLEIRYISAKADSDLLKEAFKRNIAPALIKKLPVINPDYAFPHEQRLVNNALYYFLENKRYEDFKLAITNGFTEGVDIPKNTIIRPSRNVIRKRHSYIHQKNKSFRLHQRETETLLWLMPYRLAALRNDTLLRSYGLYAVA